MRATVLSGTRNGRDDMSVATLFQRSRSRGCGADGFIVVAALWILAALATLASVYAIYISNTAAAFGVHHDRLEANALVRAAVELTAYRLSAETNNATALRGSFDFRIGSSRVVVDFRS